MNYSYSVVVGVGLEPTTFCVSDKRSKPTELPENIKFARPENFEIPTPDFGDQCSASELRTCIKN